MSFGKTLSAFRKSKGISQEGLADLLGVTRQAVSKWETEESQPEMGNLLMLCEILEVAPNQLLGWEKESGTGAQEDGTAGKLKKKWRAVTAVCICIALAAGILLGSAGSLFPKEESLLEAAERADVLAFDYNFAPPVHYDKLMLTCMPAIADESLTYEIVRLDSKGNTKIYPAEYKDGVCIAYVETVAWEWVTYILRVSDEDSSVSCPLFKVYDHNDHSYTHEELWEQG